MKFWKRFTALALIASLLVLPSGLALAETAKAGDQAGITIQASRAKQVIALTRGVWTFECRDFEGRLKWTYHGPNLITNVGLNHILDSEFNASGYTSAFYVGLKGSGAAAAGDTAASHSGWSEVTDYSEGVRQDYTTAAASSQSITNSASKASFSINGSATVAGAFLITDDTKGGSSGTLLAVVDFSGSRSVVSGDTITVTYTVTLADSWNEWSGNNFASLPVGVIRADDYWMDLAA
jgi:hypothetical protein